MFELFLTFLKIGAVSFGGGYGMIPLLTEEVLAHGWLVEEEILNFIAVAESTPGPIAINMATFIGSSQYGFIGALLATIGVVLPAFIIILIIAAILKRILKYAGVQGFLAGVRPVVTGLIIGTGITILLSVILGLKTVNDSVVFDWRALVIFVLISAFAITWKKLRKKSVSPILLIGISAILGMLLYGVLGFI